MTWTLKANLRGPKGEQGDQGIPGLGAVENDAGVSAYVASDESATDAELRKKFIPWKSNTVYVTDPRFGAKGDWVTGTGNGTDNLAAFNAALTAALAENKNLFIPSGSYRLSGEWNIWRASSPRKDLVIEGSNPLNTFLVADFYGADKALMKSVDPAGASRSSPMSIYNLGFLTVSRSGGTNPVFLDILGWSESNISSLRFSSNNNTHFRLGSSLGVRLTDIVSLYGGKNYVYKGTNGITFDLAANGTLTSTADLFTADDVGKIFYFNHATVDESRGRYVIASVTNARTAVVATDKPIYAGTASPGHFEPARVTITSGSSTLTANAPCFTEGDVGRVFYIRGARSGAYGQEMMRAKVINVASPTVAVLDRTANRSVTNTPFAVPVMDFWSNSSTTPAAAPRNTYMTVNGLRVEAFAGLAVGLMDGVELHWDEVLLHGEHGPTDTRASTGMLWANNVGGVISMDLDGGCTGDVRLAFSNFNDTLKIPYLSSRRVRNEPLIRMEASTASGGCVDIGNFTVYRHEDLGVIEMIQDMSFAAFGVRRIMLSGTVAMVGGSKPVRHQLGMTTYVTADGNLVLTAANKTEWRVIVSNTGALTTTAV